jgi:hypothetical protein
VFSGKLAGSDFAASALRQSRISRIAGNSVMLGVHEETCNRTRSLGKEPNLIQVFDKSGTPLYLTKEEWRTKVLPGMLSARWESPDELYQVIVGTLQDGLPADVAEAPEHLYQIDPNRSRALRLGERAVRHESDRQGRTDSQFAHSAVR